MSRVDEAIRRAAERPAEESEPLLSTTESSGAAPIDAAAAVSGEAFPIEMPERWRPPRRTTAAPSSRPAKVDVSVSTAATTAPPKTTATLFERIDDSLAEKVVIDQNMMPTSREQYRRLAATLHHAQQATGLTVVMIASAAPGEGKTLTAANLALTFSESYQRRVLLIDADLRRPALHRIFGTDNTSGLSEGLLSAVERKVPVRRVSERLALLQAGQPNSDPMAGLTSDRMRRLVAEARESFDWIVIDSPPVALLPDAHLLAAMVDGAVVVVKAGATSYELVKRAVETIGRDKILGVVLNRAESEARGYGYNYYDAYYGAGAAVRK